MAVIEFEADRASKLFQAAINNIIKDGHADEQDIYFTYIIGGKFKHLQSDKINAQYFRLINKKIYNKLANKKTLAKSLKAAGISDLFPATYDTVEAALSHPAEEGAVWFMKDSNATAGKGMSCLSHSELSNLTLPERHILQAEIKNIKLLEGRKFVVRFYILVWNGQAFLFRDGFMVVHGTDYIKGSTDYEVQINHAGYEKDAASVKLIPLSHHSEYDEYFPAIQKAGEKLLPILQECLAESSPTDYIFLGIDGIMQDAYGFQLIEVNSIPNFVHTQEIIEDVNIPFFEASLRKIFGLQGEGLIPIKGDMR